MSIKIIQERLNSYLPKNNLEEENALKEITQEIALAGLSRAEFFKVGAFQGGTCLRILYGLNRFSEDLDFSLLKPNSAFNWAPYLKSLEVELETYGYQIQTQDRSSQDSNVKSAFLKDDSVGKILILKHRNSGTQKSLKIKLEIDINPPLGGVVEQKYIDFPVTVPIITHNLSSLFAGKSHALLARPWEKGRDWYDFIWYVGKKISPNFNFLKNAIQQMGPWQGQGVEVTPEWYISRLKEKIMSVDWEKNKKDVERFLKRSDLDLIHTWNEAFFLDRLQVLSEHIYSQSQH